MALGYLTAVVAVLLIGLAAAWVGDRLTYPGPSYRTTGEPTDPE
jgi:hypothetical protein